MPIPADLLAILVCPVCKGELVYDATAGTFTCNACRLRYRVTGDIANFVVPEAEKF